MGAVSGLATTFDIPNYHGELFQVTPTETPLLSASGGLAGAAQTGSTIFEWQTVDLRDAAIRARLEGADAPTAEERSKSVVYNVVQIFQEAVSTSWTAAATRGQFLGRSAAPYFTPEGVGREDVAVDPHTEQVMLTLKTMARDINYAFWHAVQNIPTSNSTARQMKGLLQAIATNRTASGEVTGLSASTDTISETSTAVANGDKIVFTSVGASTAIFTDRVYYVVNKSTNAFKVAATAGGSAITIGTATVAYIPADNTFATVDDFEAILQGIYDNGGITDAGTATLFTSSRQKRMLTKLYADAYAGASTLGGTRNIGGVALDTIVTNFGQLNVVIDRALPPDAIAIVSLEQIQPVFLPIPGKGVLFETELAQTGASDKSQIYGEIGLKYGNEKAHGVVRGLAV